MGGGDPRRVGSWTYFCNIMPANRRWFACSGLALVEHENFETLSIKQLRNNLESERKIPAGVLDKNLLLSVVNDFRSIKKGISEDSKGIVKGKYSMNESALIIRIVHEYVQSNGLDISAVCPGLRDEPQSIHHAVWDELHTLLPHRLKRSIYDHAYRKLMVGTQTGTWTKEEIEVLEKLVEEHGFKWALIGRSMGKYKFDCKDAYSRSRPRQCTGKFSILEEAEITCLVKRLYGVSKTSECPLMGVPWSHIADQLGRVRHALDYQRHWPIIWNKGVFGYSVMCTREEERARDGALIATLQEMDVEDESEVTWAAMDRELLVPPSSSLRRWRLLCKQCVTSDEYSFKSCLDELFVTKVIDFTLSQSNAAAAAAPIAPKENDMHEITSNGKKKSKKRNRNE
eukprot:gene4044-8049_t